MRAVVYAEGAGEAPASLFAPGRVLAEHDIGPAHVLVRRCLAADGTCEEGEVEFLAPRRLASGRHARGSDLLVASVLRKLFTRVPAVPEEDLTVLLVDQDGDGHRERQLQGLCESHPRRIAIGVAVPEFEAWLLGDLGAVRAVLGREVEEPPAVETLSPGAAKERFRSLCPATEHRRVRLELARTVDLDRLMRLRAFEAFRKGLRQATTGH